jgi:hypothetical protein
VFSLIHLSNLQDEERSPMTSLDAETDSKLIIIIIIMIAVRYLEAI